MPRPKATDKFYLVNRTRRRGGYPKGSRFLGFHNGYSGSDVPTLKELNDFLEKNKVDPAKVIVPMSFITTVIP